MPLKVTLDDLRSGRRAQIKPSEYAQLRGCSQATLSRERWDGTGIPFKRDPVTKRILYDAKDVLADLDGCPKYHATCEYTHDRFQRMELARSAKAVKASA